MRQTILFLSLLLLLPPADLTAKEFPLIALGARVRIYAPSLIDGQVTGKVVKLNADTLMVALRGPKTPLQVPCASIESLEIYRGVDRKIGKGMAIGTVIGAGVGAYVGYGLSGISFDGEKIDRSDRLEMASICGFALGLLGASVGAGIGVLRGDERWEKVPLGCIRAGITPQRHGGVRLAMSFTF
jgi:hypothetical protein